MHILAIITIITFIIIVYRYDVATKSARIGLKRH